MKRFSFTANVIAALLLSTLGVMVYSTLQPWFDRDVASRLLLLLLSLGYLLFLLHQCRPRFGLSLVISGWVLSCLLLVLFNPPLLVWLALSIGVLWLVRSVLRYQQLYKAGLDGLLNLFATGCAFSVLMFTHSLWLSLWSYFLSLAFTAAIPARPAHRTTFESTNEPYNDARASAESALRRLQKSTTQPHS